MKGSHSKDLKIRTSITPMFVNQNPSNPLNPRDGGGCPKGTTISTQKAAAVGCSSIKLKRFHLVKVSMNHEACNLMIFANINV